MSIQNAGLLPANILTTNQYESQQMKASTEEDALAVMRSYSSLRLSLKTKIL